MASLASLLVTALLTGAAALAPVQAAPWRVSIDTTTLAGTSGFVAFDFFGGSAATGNLVRIGNLVFNGTLGTAVSTGAVSGSLPAGTLTLGGGSGLFSEWLQGVNFGTTLVFDLELGDVVPGVGERPDQFSLFLLNAALLPYASDDPTFADALLAIDLVGDGTVPLVFGSDFASLRIEPLAGSVVSVPGTTPLVALGLVALMAHRRRHAVPAAG